MDGTKVRANASKRNPKGGRPYKRKYGEPEGKAQSNFTDPESGIMQTSSRIKKLWPHFEERFTNKEVLATRVGQLAELRNCIRHSRSVDKITRMDGEASILWFEQVNRR